MSLDWTRKAEALFQLAVLLAGLILVALTLGILVSFFDHELLLCKKEVSKRQLRLSSKRLAESEIAAAAVSCQEVLSKSEGGGC